MTAFLPLCEVVAAESGGVAVVALSQEEAAAAVKRLGRTGPCVHLCFALPPEGCPAPPCATVPVFGWGMGTIPTETWDFIPSTDWRVPLGAFGQAIGISGSVVSAVRAALGPAFPVCCVMPPSIVSSGAARARTVSATLALPGGRVLDTARWTRHRPPVVQFDAADDLAEATAATPSEEVLFRAPPQWKKTVRYRLGTTRLHAREWYHDALGDLVPRKLTKAGSMMAHGAAKLAYFALSRTQGRRRGPPSPVVEAGPPATLGDDNWQAGPVSISGTVFCAVHGMWDRSWSDAISAFVFAFREEEQACLVIRAPCIDVETREALAGYVRRLLPFRCRVVLMEAELASDEREALLGVCSYYVCASHAEAAPLPIMRFMAHGRPAIAPRHSALLDLVDEECAIPVASSEAHDYWPGDSRERLLTTSHRLDWEGLCAAYWKAFALAADEVGYARLQAAAMARIEALNASGEAELRAFLNRITAGSAAGGRRAA